jgi:glycosyltransferase involved in cell wall biosynthesis
LLAGGRLRLEPLPWAYHPLDHLKHRAEVRQRFARWVSEHRYLCFSNLGPFGAWGSVAAAEARRQQRPYSLWFDWVLHRMPLEPGATPRQRLKHALMAQLIERETTRAIRGAALGLFHGQTVFDAYAPLCRQPELVHDVHTHPEDAISDDDLAAKLARQVSGLDARRPLRIGYVGRVHPMKAPFDWIEALARAAEVLGAERIQATWLGDGPLLDAARERVRSLGVEANIRFEGFVADRSRLLAFLREQDLLLFCHITPESPRALVEALISGTPLLGYDSAYARQLVAERGGAILTPLSDTKALTTALIRLADDPQALAELTRQAATARAIYNDEAVFAHRSELIKRFAV